MLSHASVPTSYWPYAFAPTVYLINRMPTDVLHGDSPYHKLFDAHPNYLKLRVFGCVCYMWLRPYRQNKLEARSTPCVFLGYSLTHTFTGPLPALVYSSPTPPGSTPSSTSIQVVNMSSAPPPPAHSTSPPLTDLHPPSPPTPTSSSSSPSAAPSSAPSLAQSPAPSLVPSLASSLSHELSASHSSSSASLDSPHERRTKRVQDMSNSEAQQSPLSHSPSSGRSSLSPSPNSSSSLSLQSPTPTSTSPPESSSTTSTAPIIQPVPPSLPPSNQHPMQTQSKNQIS
ncbi:PREDICTED: putative protein TPRXL [Camelina sativa]|uniref:Retroviral polymerase SH3-like domain-containing protein n=1 Tax=Camelina sativa TaxID=90675 RepID=A0ABM0WPJ8_CAMSA|nr:PREDICTED: putative protein TPRXL [Camelina sativa]